MKRIQRKRTNGWRKPENTVNVTRPGRWGNPFPVEVFGLEKSLDLYERWLNDEWIREMYPYANEHEHKHGKPSKKFIREWLGGKNLMCFCSLDQKCHADILLKIANPE